MWDQKYAKHLDTQHQSSVSKETKRTQYEIQRRVYKILGQSMPSGDDYQHHDLRRNVSKRESFENSRLKMELVKKKESKNFQKSFEKRRKLPARQKSIELLNAIKGNQIILVVGSNECGKSTQIPQLLLDEYILNNKASECRIVCVQLREQAAQIIAQRIAYERDEDMCYSVGYHVKRGLRAPRDSGSILFCSAGILMHYFKNDPLLTRFSAVILDDWQDKTFEYTQIMDLLSMVLPIRPDLKLIMLSTNTCKKRIREYFKHCHIFKIDDGFEETNTTPEGSHRRTLNPNIDQELDCNFIPSTYSLSSADEILEQTVTSRLNIARKSISSLDKPNNKDSKNEEEEEYRCSIAFLWMYADTDFRTISEWDKALITNNRETIVNFERKYPELADKETSLLLRKTDPNRCENFSSNSPQESKENLSKLVRSTSRNDTRSSKERSISSKERSRSSKEHSRLSKERSRSSKERLRSSKERSRSSKERTRSSKERPRRSKERSRSSKERLRSSRERSRSSKERLRSSRERSSKDQSRSSKERSRSSKERSGNGKQMEKSHILDLDIASKRSRSSNEFPDESYKSLTRTISNTNHNGQVAIVDYSDLDGKIKPDDWLLLEKLLLNEMISDKWSNDIISFDGSEWSNGVKIIRCDNERSLEFLEVTIARIGDLWPGARLAVIPQSRLPLRTFVNMWIPPPVPATRNIFELLAKQNEGLAVDDWQILSSTPCDIGAIFRLAIDATSLSNLKDCQGRVRYGFGFIKIKQERPM